MRVDFSGLTHVIATNRMLAQEGHAFPLGLILERTGEVEVLVAAYERPEQIGDLVGALRARMTSRVSEEAAIAACILVPERSGRSVVAFLENHENFCAKVSIPIAGDTPTLDAENLTVEDGAVLVFQVVSS